MTKEHIFVPIRTMPWEDCELCADSAIRMFQLWGDRNGAIVCQRCANESGRIITWEDSSCQ